MARAAVDADFNSAGRSIDYKLDIYFDAETPLTVTKATYLIDAAWLEEMAADSGTPFGAPSSNELSFRLYNDGGLFSPTNAAGIYFGKIKVGVKIIPYIRPTHPVDEVNWLQLGTYYVTSWDAQLTNTYVDVVVNDEWYFIFNSPMVNYPVSKAVAYDTLLAAIFTLLGRTVTIDGALTRSIPYAYISQSTRVFIADILSAGLAYASCSKEGVPQVKSLVTTRSLRATLTDGNQIKTANASQALTKTYDGVALNYSIPTLRTDKELTTVADLTIPTGASTITGVVYNNKPVWDVQFVKCACAAGNVTVTSYESTQDSISITLQNDNASPVEVTLFVYGTFIDFAAVVLEDTCASPFVLSNSFIQYAAHAADVKAVLNSYVAQDIPTLNVSIKGNPLLSIGDLVQITSTRYALSYEGIIQRLQYRYDGGLSCEMTLLNSAILEEGE